MFNFLPIFILLYYARTENIKRGYGLTGVLFRTKDLWRRSGMIIKFYPFAGVWTPVGCMKFYPLTTTPGHRLLICRINFIKLRVGCVWIITCKLVRSVNRSKPDPIVIMSLGVNYTLIQSEGNSSPLRERIFFLLSPDSNLDIVPIA